MRNLPLFFLVAFICFVEIHGQGLFETPSKKSLPPKLTLYGLVYPIGVNGESFKTLLADYRVTDKFGIQLQHFYSRYGMFEGFRTSYLLKWYVRERLYLFAGPETDHETNPITGDLELLRVNLNIGLGYEVSPTALLQLGIHPEMGPPVWDNFGRKLPRQNTISLRANF